MKGVGNMKIQLQNVSKRFKNNLLFDQVNITFESGKIYGLIGPNGTGKTVLMKIISGIMKPTEGTILCDDKILGKDIRVLPNVGVIFEKPEFFNDLNAEENLALLARINQRITKKEIEEVIKEVGLNFNNKAKVKTYSLGMVQRLGIAQAIMENQGIMILDEPTNALDEDGIELIHQILKQKKEEGKLIIVSSHNSYDIQQLCDGVYKINNGKVIRYEKD